MSFYLKCTVVERPLFLLSCNATVIEERRIGSTSALVISTFFRGRVLSSAETDNLFVRFAPVNAAGSPIGNKKF